MITKWEILKYGKLIQYAGGPILAGCEHGITACSRTFPQNIKILCTPGSIGSYNYSFCDQVPWQAKGMYFFKVLQTEEEDTYFVVALQNTRYESGDTEQRGRKYTEISYYCTEVSNVSTSSILSLLPHLEITPQIKEKNFELEALMIQDSLSELYPEDIEGIKPLLSSLMLNIKLSYNLKNGSLDRFIKSSAIFIGLLPPHYLRQVDIAIGLETIGNDHLMEFGQKALEGLVYFNDKLENENKYNLNEVDRVLNYILEFELKNTSILDTIRESFTINNWSKNDQLNPKYNLSSAIQENKFINQLLNEDYSNKTLDFITNELQKIKIRRNYLIEQFFKKANHDYTYIYKQFQFILIFKPYIDVQSRYIKYLPTFAKWFIFDEPFSKECLEELLKCNLDVTHPVIIKKLNSITLKDHNLIWAEAISKVKASSWIQLWVKSNSDIFNYMYFKLLLDYGETDTLKSSFHIVPTVKTYLKTGDITKEIIQIFINEDDHTINHLLLRSAKNTKDLYQTLYFARISYSSLMNKFSEDEFSEILRTIKASPEKLASSFLDSNLQIVQDIFTLIPNYFNYKAVIRLEDKLIHSLSALWFTALFPNRTEFDIYHNKPLLNHLVLNQNFFESLTISESINLFTSLINSKLWKQKNHHSYIFSIDRKLFHQLLNRISDHIKQMLDQSSVYSAPISTTLISLLSFYTKIDKVKLNKICTNQHNQQNFGLRHSISSILKYLYTDVTLNYDNEEEFFYLIQKLNGPKDRFSRIFLQLGDKFTAEVLSSTSALNFWLHYLKTLIEKDSYSVYSLRLIVPEISLTDLMIEEFYFIKYLPIKTYLILNLIRPDLSDTYTNRNLIQGSYELLNVLNRDILYSIYEDIYNIYKDYYNDEDKNFTLLMFHIEILNTLERHSQIKKQDLVLKKILIELISNQHEIDPFSMISSISSKFNKKVGIVKKWIDFFKIKKENLLAYKIPINYLNNPLSLTSNELQNYQANLTKNPSIAYLMPSLNNFRTENLQSLNNEEVNRHFNRLLMSKKTNSPNSKETSYDYALKPLDETTDRNRLSKSNLEETKTSLNQEIYNPVSLLESTLNHQESKLDHRSVARSESKTTHEPTLPANHRTIRVPPPLPTTKPFYESNRQITNIDSHEEKLNVKLVNSDESYLPQVIEVSSDINLSPQVTKSNNEKSGSSLTFYKDLLNKAEQYQIKPHSNFKPIIYTPLELTDLLETYDHSNLLTEYYKEHQPQNHIERFLENRNKSTSTATKVPESIPDQVHPNSEPKKMTAQSFLHKKDNKTSDTKQTIQDTAESRSRLSAMQYINDSQDIGSKSSTLDQKKKGFTAGEFLKHRNK